MFQRTIHFSLWLPLATALTALAFGQCGEPQAYSGDFDTLYRPLMTFSRPTLVFPAGTCTPRVELIPNQTSSSPFGWWLRIYYPCTGDVVILDAVSSRGATYNGNTLPTVTQALTDLCGQDWFQKYFGPNPSSSSRTSIAQSLPARPLLVPGTTQASGQASQGFLVADVNGDGNPDNIYLRSDGVVQLLDSNGAILSTLHFDPGFSPTPFNSHLIAADFNGDGNLDLAVSYYGDTNTNLGGTVFILLGNGDGTFSAPVSFNAGPNPLSLAAVDFNGDGKLDLAVTNIISHNVSVLDGNGDGTFGAPVTYATTTPGLGSPRSLLAIDLNGDGAPDLAVAFGNSVSVLLNSGRGTFGQPLITMVPFIPAYLAYADLNHDGMLDLAVAGSLNAIVLLFGKGDGTFQQPVAYTTGNNPASLGVMPLQDGSTLLITADQFTSNAWFTVLAPDGTTGAPRLNSVGGRPIAIAAGDLNGDGQPDAIVAGAATDLAVLLAQGTQFGAPKGYSLAPSGQNSPGPQAIAVGDLNGDGKADVIVANSGNPSVSVSLGNGDGTLKAPTSTPINQGASGIALGDFNRDGKLDVAVAAFGIGAPITSDVGGVVVLFGKGDGTFQAPVTLTAGSPRPVSVAVADLNGDGKLDLAAVMIAPDHSIQPVTLAIFLGRGDGSFAPALTTKLNVNAFAIAAIAVGDLNGDGMPDLAIASDQKGADILLGNGDGTFRELAQPTTERSLSGVALADVDGDGALDMIILGDDGAYLLGNGDGTFQAEQHFASGPSPDALAVAVTSGSPVAKILFSDSGQSIVALQLFKP